jgi:hypothetical protein
VIDIVIVVDPLERISRPHHHHHHLLVTIVPILQ